MFKKSCVLLMFFYLAACATSENKIAEYIKKNPKIIFDVIEENPEKFVEVANKSARKAQDARYAKQIQQQEEQYNNPLKPVLKDEQRVFGEKTAPIVIVEYADFQCPACRMAHETLKSIKEKYKDKIQFYYKNMPLDFHKMAMPSARYFEAVKLADKSKAEKFFNYVFNEQKLLKDENFLKKAIKQVGLDTQAVSKKLNSSEIEKNIAADMKEFQDFGFTGTPVILINGVTLYGAQPMEEIEKVIIKLIAKK